jgi:hypothetical protein
MIYCSNILQQNSFDLSSDNLEILIIQHLRRVVPRMEVLLTITFGMHIDSVNLLYVFWMLCC